MEKKIGVLGRFERCRERRNQVVGQVADEPDGIGEQRLASGGDLPTADKRCERGEQLILYVNIGRCERI